MDKVIIHPTDFSEASNTALQFAEELAKSYNSELLIVHSLDKEKLEGYELSGATLLQRSKELHQESLDKLKLLGESAIKKGVRCRAQLYEGQLIDWLPEVIKRQKPQLVVMGTTGADSINNRIFGSNTYAIIQNSKSPVLAIPNESNYKTFKEIVVAADLEKPNHNLFSFINELANHSQAQLRVVYSVNQKNKDKGKEMMSLIKEKLLDQDLLVHLDMVEGNYIEVVGNYLLDQKADLFAIEVSHKNYLEKLFEGSLTRKLIHQSTKPLLLIPREMDS